jgi:hypothetical protein
MVDFVWNSPLEVDALQLSLGKDDFTWNAPPLDLAPGEVVLIQVRAPQFGIPLYAKQRVLQEQLPSGAARYVGLFSSMPDRAGVGGVEAFGSGYGRVLHSSWTNEVIGGFIARRTNEGAIEFQPLTGNLRVIGWGIWDAPTLGLIQALGLLRIEGTGNPLVFSLENTDIPRFSSHALTVGIQ